VPAHKVAGSPEGECVVRSASWTRPPTPWQALGYDEPGSKRSARRPTTSSGSGYVAPRKQPAPPVRARRARAPCGLPDRHLRLRRPRTDLRAPRPPGRRNGAAPPASTAYQVTTAVSCPPKPTSERACNRHYYVHRSTPLDARWCLGERHLRAVVEAPPSTGTVVSGRWDFTVRVNSPLTPPPRRVMQSPSRHAAHKPSRAGHLRPALRVEHSGHNNTQAHAPPSRTSGPSGSSITPNITSVNAEPRLARRYC